MQLPRYVSDYSPEITKVSFSYLLELTATLREYYDSLVLIGGWAPFLILENYKKPNIEFTHIGSIDIDLAIDPQLFSQGLDKYRTIIEHIERIGYVPKKDKLGNIVPASYAKQIKENVNIQVDFLTAEDIPLGKTRRHFEIQPDLMARRAKGCDTVFNHHWDCPLAGNLPGNGKIELKIKVADIVSAIVMKGYALGGRLDGKDAYDIYSMMAYYKDGPKSVASEFKTHINLSVVSEALKTIAKEFKDIETNGPVRVGSFLYPNDETMRQKAITDAYMTVQEFFDLIKSV